MSRYLLLIPVAWLVAQPVGLLPVRPIATLAALAGLLCVTGVLWRSIALVSAGGTVALVAYALALWLAASPLDMPGTLAFGVALWLIVNGTDFARRFHGASVHRSAVRRQLRYWVEVTATSSMVVIVFDVLARLLAFAAPQPVYAVIAALGALGAVMGVVGMLRRETSDVRS
jgi:hypothetical protein